MSSSPASRAWSRLRAARLLLVLLAVGLAVWVAATIWMRRPAPRAGAQRSSPTAPSGAIQSLEKFVYTSSVSGKKAWSIVADRLLSLEGGVYAVDGVRHAEVVLKDGRLLTGSADRATFVQIEPTAGKPVERKLELSGHVRLTAEGGESFECERLEYLEQERKVRSPGPVAFAFAGNTGKGGRMEYAIDPGIVTLSGGVELSLPTRSGEPVHVQAATARVKSDGSTARFDGAASASLGGDLLTAPTLEVERTTGTDPSTTIRAFPHPRGLLIPQRGGASGPSGSPAGPPARPVRFEADRLEAVELGAARTVTLEGSASIVEDAPEPAAARSLRGSRIVLREESGLRRVQATGSVSGVLPPAKEGAPPRTIDCEVLEAVIGTDGALQDGSASGGVRFSEGERRARAEAARFVGEERVELRGGRPRVEDPERRLTADEIDLFKAPARLEARGSVATHFVPSSESTAGPFERGKAVDVASDTAVIEEVPRTARFTGRVTARQGEQAVSAAELTVDDADKTAKATGHVVFRGIRTQSGSGSNGAAPPTRTPERIPVQAEGDVFDYDRATRTSRFTGSARWRESGGLLSADNIGAVESAEGRPARLDAEGHVKFEGEGRKGASDVAHYESEARRITLVGLTAPARVEEPASGRSWSGPSLTWLLGADSIPLVAGDAGRSRVDGGGPPRKGEVGRQQADRSGPRQDLSRAPRR